MIYLIIIFFLLQKPDINMRSRAIYNSMGKSCASDNLKTVEVKCQDIDKKVHKLIMSLNSYGIPLEKINIQQTNESYECKFSIPDLQASCFSTLLFYMSEN